MSWAAGRLRSGFDCRGLHRTLGQSLVALEDEFATVLFLLILASHFRASALLEYSTRGYSARASRFANTVADTSTFDIYGVEIATKAAPGPSAYVEGGARAAMRVGSSTLSYAPE